MSQVKTAPRPAAQAQTAAPAAPPAAGPDGIIQELKVTGHLMTLPAGMFSFVNEPNAASAGQHGLPGVRLSAPPSGEGNVEVSGFRVDGWLSGTGDAALVRVKKGPAQLLVTIYQLAGAPPETAPKLQVRQLLAGGAPAPAQAAATAAAAAAQPADMLAHIQARGDVGAAYGEWLGERGSNQWIEGFALNAPAGIDPADLSYQAVLGRGWLSPWLEAGEYCGSRGMALPLLGLRVRLNGEAAEHYEVSYSAHFIGGTSAGPVGNDETCEGDTLAP
jgi:hypothetical protein